MSAACTAHDCCSMHSCELLPTSSTLRLLTRIMRLLPVFLTPCRLVASGSFDGSVTVKRAVAFAPVALASSGAGAMAEDGVASKPVAAAAGAAAEVRAAAHVGAASSVHLVELAGDAAAVLATGGHDGAVRLWAVASHAAGSSTAAGRKTGKAAAAAATAAGSSLSLRQYAELSGSRGPVRCVRMDPTCRLVAGADAAGNVFLWSATEESASTASSSSSAAGEDDAAAGAAGAAARPAVKRARTARSRAGSEAHAHADADGSSAGSAGSSAALAGARAIVDREPVVQLLGAHRGAATGLAWLSEESFASCGLDGAVRIWEVRLASRVAAEGGDSDDDSSSDDEDDEAEDGGAAAAAKKAAKAKAKAAKASSAGAGPAAAGASAGASVQRLECLPVVSLSGGKAAFSLAASPLGSLLASAHADGAVRVWDARGRAGSAAGGAGGDASAGGADGLRATLAIHATTAKVAAAALADVAASASASAGGKKGKAAAAAASAAAEGAFGTRDAESTWVASVSWCPSSSHHVAVASMSGVVSVWDTRSPSAPLFTLGTHVQQPVAAAATGAGASSAAGSVAGAGPAAKALCVTWAGAAEAADAGAGADASAGAGAGSSASASASASLPQLVLSGGTDKQVRCSAMAAPLA